MDTRIGRESIKTPIKISTTDSALLLRMRSEYERNKKM